MFLTYEEQIDGISTIEPCQFHRPSWLRLLRVRRLRKAQQDLYPPRVVRGRWKQLPLLEGRKVAFRPPIGVTADGSNTDSDANRRLPAVITQCIDQDKNRYTKPLGTHQQNYSHLNFT